MDEQNDQAADEDTSQHWPEEIRQKPQPANQPRPKLAGERETEAAVVDRLLLPERRPAAHERPGDDESNANAKAAGAAQVSFYRRGRRARGDASIPPLCALRELCGENNQWSEQRPLHLRRESQAEEDAGP